MDMRLKSVVLRMMVLFFVGGAVWGEGGAVRAEEGEVSASGDLPLESEGGLRFFVDSAQFLGPEGFTRQEMYVLIDAGQLQFEVQDGASVARMKLTVVVKDTMGKQVVDRTWNRRVSVDSLEALGEARAPFRDVAGVDLVPGVYRAAVTVEDAAADRQGTCEAVLRIQDFESPGLTFSDLQFASDVVRSGETHRFAKQGWRISPNVTRRYLSGEPLPVYFELYNVRIDSGRVEDSFILGYSLVDSSGQVLKTFPAKRVLKPGENCAAAEILDTRELAAGVYSLQVEAFDGSNREYVRVRRAFSVASGQPPIELTQLQKEMLRYFSDIRYVANEKELKAFDELPDWPSRMKFLREFWFKMDPSPGTAMNERLFEHMMRMNYAENRFVGWSKKRGVDTDRGRIYVQHGAPDDIDFHASVTGGKPYEVWVYDRERHYEFVFRDRRGNGIFELVHSTYPGELFNPYWQDEL